MVVVSNMQDTAVKGEEIPLVVTSHSLQSLDQSPLIDVSTESVLECKQPAMDQDSDSIGKGRCARLRQAACF